MIKGGGFHAIGRRKNAVARVYLRPGAGKFLVNGHETKEYFGRASLDLLLREPLVKTGVTEKFDISANVNGGGKSGQAGALRLALGRVLIDVDAALRPMLKEAGMLSRDSREVERKKYGRHKARKRPQFSKR
ncbi:MAG: 30S ribosomal protein S9 [Proteobacteria bacterium]|jgi:small subunit ribosomal protein S9|nr:30S ribosomal protein S9 [Pseudomonadota bacterium]